MMNWLQNPLADYVIAAYGVAAFVLVGLLLVSWWASRCRTSEWRNIQSKRKGRA